MKDIVIDINLFDEASVNHAIRQVKEYRKWLDKKTAEFLERLSSEGVSIANYRFESALYSGVNDVEVSFQKIREKEYAVIALGQQTLFIEFGTGIYNPDNPAERAEVVSGDIVAHGKYGKGFGMHKKWAYQGEAGNAGWPIASKPGWSMTAGVPAQSCLYYSRRELQGLVTQIAREVFS